jgi:hypothetical protein
MAVSTVMTAQHQKFYDLVKPDGTTAQITSKRKTAACWLTMCRLDLPPGWTVVPSMTVWFASERTDQDDLERHHADLDRRYGL